MPRSQRMKRTQGKLKVISYRIRIIKTGDARLSKCVCESLCKSPCGSTRLLSNLNLLHFLREWRCNLSDGLPTMVNGSVLEETRLRNESLTPVRRFSQEIMSLQDDQSMVLLGTSQFAPHSSHRSSFVFISPHVSRIADSDATSVVRPWASLTTDGSVP
jgi:hypothetical protein